MIEYGDARLPERFWKKVVPEANSGCWLWHASVKMNLGRPQKYANYSHEGRTRVVTQVLAEVFFSEVDLDKWRPEFSCDTVVCANPNHMVFKDRSYCARGHKKEDGKQQCPECKAVTMGHRGPRNRSAGGRITKIREGQSHKQMPLGFSVFGDRLDPNRELWRPPGWPKEVLGGRLQPAYSAARDVSV